MEFEIRDESEKGRFILKTFGNFSVPEHVVTIRELTSHPNWKKGMNLLVDHSKVSIEDFGVEEVPLMAESLAAANELFGCARHAIIVPRGGYFKATMVKFLADPKIRWTVKLFEDYEYDAAIVWLESGIELAPPHNKQGSFIVDRPVQTEGGSGPPAS